MHTGECNDAREYWPEGKGTDVDVSGLPAAGAVTTARRIPGIGKWLGFWGPSFSGLRVGYSPTDSYPVINGLAVPYPIDLDDEGGVDLYLSRDTGGGGNVSIARFKTEAAARAWGGQPTPGTGSSSGTASLPNRSTTTRETVAGGVISHAWTQAGFLFATVKALKANAANIVVGGSFAIEPGAAENNFVSTATGFSATGTDGDILDIIEYGRV